jgi:hypothetical protein
MTHASILAESPAPRPNAPARTGRFRNPATWRAVGDVRCLLSKKETTPKQGPTRRGVLLLAAGAAAQIPLRLYAASGEFWNKKDPADWSSDEIGKLTSKSPWAKDVNAASGALSRPYADGGVPDASNGGGNRGYPSGGTGSPGGGGGYGRGAGRNTADSEMPLSYRATVRWESAQPIRDALKSPLPQELAGDYVISVSGVPILARGRQHTEDGENEATISKGLSAEVLERIKDLTYLEPKGKEPAQPALVLKGQITSAGMPTLLFGFPREVMPITADDGQVTFTTNLGQIEVRAKFVLKDMMYHKELAL